MIVATFLDPSMQKLPLISAYCRANDVDMSDILIKKWMEYEPDLYINRSDKAEVPALNKTSQVSRLRRELIQKHVVNECLSEDGYKYQIRQEHLKYTTMADMVDDPLVWWKAHQDSFPYLSSLAKVMLSIPSSSGATEHHFSETGYLVTKKKANLDPLTVEKTMFIHDNFKYISTTVQS